MKRFVIFAGITAAFVFFGCNDFSNLEMPERLSIKTGASFNLPVGTKSINIADEITVDKLRDTLKGEDEDSSEETDEDSSTLATKNISVYEYAPQGQDDEVRQYILDYQIAKIPLGLKEEQKEGFDTDNMTFTYDYEVEIPDFTENISENLTLNKEISAVEPGDKSLVVPFPSVDFTITSPEYNYMEVRSGRLKIDVSPQTTPSSDFSMIAVITLTDSSGNRLAPSSAETNLASGGTVYIDLAGARLVQKMALNIVGVTSGGTFGNKLTYKVKAGPEDLKFSKIVGLTMKNNDLGEKGTVTLDDKDIKLELNSAIKEAIIKDGYISLACLYPSGWNGIKCEGVKNSEDKETEFNLSGGITVSYTQFENNSDENDNQYVLNKKADLSDKKITGEDTKLTSTRFVFEFDNATIVFSDSEEAEKLTLSVECKISELDYVIIDTSVLEKLTDGTDEAGNPTNEIDTGLSFSTLLEDLVDGSDDLSALIEDIEFSGINGYLFMTYPDTEADGDSDPFAELASLSFTADVEATYNKDSGADQTTKLINNQTVSMKKSAGSIASLADENFVIGAAGETFITNNKSAEITTMTDLINKKPDNLRIKYDLSLGSTTTKKIELKGTMLDTLIKGNASIDVSIAIILPLQIKLVDNADIPKTNSKSDGYITIDDVMALTGDEDEELKDLLDRDDDDDDDKWSKYSKAVESFSLKYDVNNNLILNKNSREALDLEITLCTVNKDGTPHNLFDGETEDSEKTNEKKLYSSGGTLSFSKDEIDAILTNPPFIPRVKVRIPVSGEEQYIPRNGSFGVGGIFHLKFDENEEVEIYNKND